MSSRTDEAAFRAMVDRWPESTRELALAARRLILETLPETYEVVWGHQGTAGYGTGPRKMTEHFSWIAPARGHVGLGFFYGAELPDPVGLLEGTGKLLRHVKLRSPDDLHRPELRALLEAAIRHRVPPPQPL